jgi:glycosyltransferase involved in cell wall biosynthesis
MNINFVLQGLSLNGGVKVILKVARGLQERGHHVVVSALEPVTPSSIEWLGSAVELRIHARRSAHRRAVLKALRIAGNVDLSDDDEILHLTRLVTKTEINVATAWRTAYAVALACSGPSAYYIQHYEPLFERTEMGSRKATLSYSLPHRHIANSSWLAGRLIEHGQKPPVVLPALEHDVFFPDGAGQDEPPTVLTFCDRRVWKGYGDVLMAFEIVARRRPDVQFAAYGRLPPHRSSSSVRVRYHLAPTGAALARLYRQATVFVLGSWYESSPLQPIEAMACGTPVVTTPLGTEDWSVDEGNVLIAAPKDPEKLAGRILDALASRELRARLSTSGLATAGQFTWENTVDAAEAALLKISQA